ncbi:MAG TPA: hypothetical protein VJG90_04990 [Candidatus Nanoarchaeia archaeon]|nr:hypothetical protein [Candidatus Nanoarchaeia archaeon]
MQATRYEPTVNNQDLHQEILEKALRDPVPKPWRKPIIIFVSIFLIILLFNYLLPELFLYLNGRINTQTPNGYEITWNQKRIVFNSEVYNQLKGMYRTLQTREYKACLLGKQEGSAYYLQEIYWPETYSDSVYHVTAAPCPPETLVSLHSHPPEHCVVSEQDLKSHAAFQENNPTGISAIQCGEERFGFYGHES